MSSLKLPSATKRPTSAEYHSSSRKAIPHRSRDTWGGVSSSRHAEALGEQSGVLEKAYRHVHDSHAKLVQAKKANKIKS